MIWYQPTLIEQPVCNEPRFPEPTSRPVLWACCGGRTPWKSAWLPGRVCVTYHNPRNHSSRKLCWPLPASAWGLISRLFQVWKIMLHPWSFVSCLSTFSFHSRVLGKTSQQRNRTLEWLDLELEGFHQVFQAKGPWHWVTSLAVGKA